MEPQFPSPQQFCNKQDTGGDSYSSLPMQQEASRISILTRPRDSASSSAKQHLNPKLDNCDSKAKDTKLALAPVSGQTCQTKTLEQRELEYAKARQRLLGDVRFEEEEKEAELESRLSPAEILKMQIDKAMQDNTS